MSRTVHSSRRPGNLLPYPPDKVIEDSVESFPWFLVYKHSEGFQPYTIAIQTDCAQSAEEIYEEETGNEGLEDLRIVPISRVWVYTNNHGG